MADSRANHTNGVLRPALYRWTTRAARSTPERSRLGRACRRIGAHHEALSEGRPAGGAAKHDGMFRSRWPFECQHVSRGDFSRASPAASPLPATVRTGATVGAAVDEDDSTSGDVWRGHAREWFTQLVAGPASPISADRGRRRDRGDGNRHTRGRCPNPQCPRGRAVRLANVITLAGHRGVGYGTLLVKDVTDWARSIDADRVDLSATPEGQRIYARAGFVLASAPRMKLVL